MKIPKIIFSDKILNLLSWFMTIGGITLFPFVILREKYRDDPRYADWLVKTINHESIHIKQQQEVIIPFLILFIILNFIFSLVAWWLIPILGYLSFYIWYVLEFIIRLVGTWFNVGDYTRSQVYQNLSFERESYSNEYNTDYLKTRKIWAFFKYLFRK